MGATQSIKLAWSDGLRKSSGIEQCAKKQRGTLEEIVRHTRCHPYVVKTVNGEAVREGYKTGEPCANESSNAESTPLKTLILGMENKHRCEQTQCDDLGGDMSTRCSPRHRGGT